MKNIKLSELTKLNERRRLPVAEFQDGIKQKASDKDAQQNTCL